MAKEKKEVVPGSQALAVTVNSGSGNALIPKTMEEALKFAEIVSKTGMVPKDYQGNAGNVFVAVQMGLELGLPPLQALQNIAVINGRPSIWGDLALALVRNSGLLEVFEESTPSEAKKNGKGWCRIQRKGESKAAEYEFSVEDAKKAGLWGKQGPWTAYEGRMLQMRNRSFALRDKFTDILKGLSIAEEAQDYVVEREIAPGVDLVKSAKDAIVSKAAPAAAKEPEAQAPDKTGEIVDAEVRGYLIQKVTESALKKELYFVHIDGNKYATTDLKLAKQADGWSKGKVPVDFESEQTESGNTLKKVWALEPVAA